MYPIVACRGARTSQQMPSPPASDRLPNYKSPHAIIPLRTIRILTSRNTPWVSVGVLTVMTGAISNGSGAL